MIDTRLLDIVVCPSCRSALRPEPDATTASRLSCTGDDCGLVYPVRDDVPVLLVDEATRAE
ncbi:MAG TPA: Trm112 family protein [Actinomycetes bacterium]|nr:Trm112 family protein [Actinomycetes bacterium]